MTREVRITARAERELEEAHDWWAVHRSADQASEWYRGFISKIISLETDAERFPLAPENDLFPYELRQLIYGLGRRPSHRAVFTIRTDCVVVLRVRHLAQGPLEPDG